MLIIAGADILRNRGVNPATAFPGGLADPRLAQVALLVEEVDSIGYEYSKQGLVIDSVYSITPYREIAVRNGNMISVTQNAVSLDDVFNCRR